MIVAPRRSGIAGLRADLALGRRLRQTQYDVAIDFHGGPRASLLTWLSGAPERIGYEVVGRSWMYTRRIARPRALRARHSVENQWDLLAPFGVARADPSRYPIEIAVDQAAAEAVAARLQRERVGATDQLIVVHVSAGNPFRRWPIESFVEVVAALAGQSSRRRLLVTSGPSDAGAASHVLARARERLPVEARDRVLAGADVSLAELRALVDRAALYIGGDSGPVHVASASQVPILTLYGPTLPARSAPWRAASLRAAAVEVANLPCRPCDQRACLPGDFRCLTRIDPGEVIAAAERLLH